MDPKSVGKRARNGTFLGKKCFMLVFSPFRFSKPLQTKRTTAFFAHLLNQPLYWERGATLKVGGGGGGGGLTSDSQWGGEG